MEVREIGVQRAGIAYVSEKSTIGTTVGMGPGSLHMNSYETVSNCEGQFKSLKLRMEYQMHTNTYPSSTINNCLQHLGCLPLFCSQKVFCLDLSVTYT